MKMMDQITGKEAHKKTEACFREMEEVYAAMAAHIKTLVGRQQVYDRHLQQIHDRIVTLEQNPIVLQTLQTTVQRVLDQQTSHERNALQIHNRIATLEQNPMLLHSLETTIRRLKVFVTLITASSLVMLLWMFLH